MNRGGIWAELSLLRAIFSPSCIVLSHENADIYPKHLEDKVNRYPIAILGPALVVLAAVLGLASTAIFADWLPGIAVTEANAVLGAVAPMPAARSKPAASSTPISSESSPFGFHPASVVKPGYPDNGYVDATYIGVRWAREGVYAFWFLIQPDLDQPVYDFTLYDRQWRDVPTHFRILANIAPQGHIDEGRCLPGSWLPVDEAKYIAFVKATVERYDGDGLNDMPGLANPIKYWQVGNEPNEQITSDFAGLQRITYPAIKEACPDCTVLIGGVAGRPANYLASFAAQYAPILAELGGRYVDVFDFHWYGMANGDVDLRRRRGCQRPGRGTRASVGL